MAARDSGTETWGPLLPWAPDELTGIWRAPWTQPWGPEHTRPVQPAPLQSPNFRAIETVSAAAGGSRALPGGLPAGGPMGPPGTRRSADSAGPASIRIPALQKQGFARGHTAGPVTGDKII